MFTCLKCAVITAVILHLYSGETVVVPHSNLHNDHDSMTRVYLTFAPAALSQFYQVIKMICS